MIRILRYGILCLALESSLAQESIRPSQTSALASEARRQSENATGNYFMKLGPVDFSLSAAMGVEYNDNIGLAEKDRQSDFILHPTINLDAAWHVTSLNTLRFNFGVAYATYLRHSDQDSRTILIDPGSQLAFDVYVGDIVKLTFRDQFAILQNPIDEPTLSNTARFDRFQNTAGVTALFDFNDLKFVLGYDHFTYHTFNDDFNFLDRREEQFLGARACDSAMRSRSASMAAPG